MMDIILISSLAGILGTGLGGLLGIFFGTKAIGKTLSFSGGSMIGVVFFNLLPSTILMTNIFVTIVSILIGVFMVCLIDSFVLTIKSNSNSTSEKALLSTGIVLLITISLHNFPEGIAIGSSGAISLRSGLIMAIVIALHDIPEGMAIATPLVGGKMKKNKIIFLTVASGLSTIIGAIIGKLIGSISASASSICLGIAAGAMLYVVFGELLPSAVNSSTKKQSALFTISGIIVSLVILLLLK